MEPAVNCLQVFHDDEEAATIVEFAVMLMLIAGACISVMQLTGFESSGFWAGNAEAIDRVLNVTDGPRLGTL